MSRVLTVHCSWAAGLLLGGALLLCDVSAPRSVGAQQPSQQVPRQSPAPAVPATPRRDSLATWLATITTDTGALAPGHTDFTRYTTPALCLVAVRHTAVVAQRTIAAQERADTMRLHATEDTLPARVAAVARACAAKFPVAAASTTALPQLFALTLFGQQDTLVRAVVTRQLAQAPDAGAKAAVLLAAVEGYLSASPARLAAAEQTVTQLDALGASAAVLPHRVAAHQAVLQFGEDTRDGGVVRRTAATLLALAHSVPPAERAVVAEPLLAAYHALGELLAVQAPDSLPSLARQLQQDAPQFDFKTDAGQQYATLPLDSLVAQLGAVPLASWQRPRPGERTPPLQADFWFPAHAGAPDTAPPAPGRVSLFVAIPGNCYDSYVHGYVLDPIGTGCTRLYTQVRQWRAQYGTALELTLVTWTTSVGGTVLSGSQTPAAAAKNLAWYFLDYLKLPVNQLAVQMLPLAAPLPVPDGRLFLRPPYNQFNNGTEVLNIAPAFAQLYLPRLGAGGAPMLVLTGQNGQLLYRGEVSAVFPRLLARVLAPPAQPTAPAVGAPANSPSSVPASTPASPASRPSSRASTPGSAVPPSVSLQPGSV